jgi:hypothetical protein
VITPQDFSARLPPLSPAQQRAVNTYADLMAEIRERTLAAQEIFSDRVDLGARTRLEFAYLQIRMILETLALGCLVAHGDLQEVKSAQLQKAYQADFIVKRLERLHTDFFPVPHVSETDDGAFLGGRKVHHFLEAEGPRLTKADVIRMYAKAGSKLHRGSLKALAKSRADPQLDVEEISNFLEKLIALLGSHHIMTRDRLVVFLCNIPNKSAGDVAVRFAVASGNTGSGRRWLAIAEQQ